MPDSRVKSAWPAYRICGVSSFVLAAVGFIGNWLMNQFRERQGISELELMQTALGSVAVWTFSACFVIGLLVMLPMALFLQTRAGIPVRGWILPSWIARPVQAIIVVIIAMMLVLWTASLATLVYNG